VEGTGFIRCDNEAMLKKQVALVLLLAVAAIGFCTEPSAKVVLTKAQAQAKAGKKNVMVIFHASWCGWCHKLDDFLADPEMGKLMKANFVIQHVDVLENGDKKVLENEGGLTYMESFGGKNAGLPFTAMTDPSGKMLVNSSKDGKPTGNIGYPAAPDEIAHFMTMLKKSAPRMTPADLTKIEDWLKAHAPKQ